MHLAFFIPGPLATVSGGYGYDRRLIAGLVAAGHAVDVIEFSGTPADAWQRLDPGVLPVIDGLALPQFVGMAQALSTRPSVGLIHHPTALETGRSDAERAALQALERDLYARLPKIVVTSRTTGERLSAEFGVAPERITVVEPGTDPAPRSAGSGGPGCRILSIGTLVPRKGHDSLLRALARLFDLDWRLMIVGAPRDAAHAQTLYALADSLGISSRVTFAGEVVDGALDALWAEADLFALATHYEGYGMVVAEAMKRGLPVAVTAGGAAGALVSPQAGTVCPVGDEVTFSKAIRRLIYDPALRAEAAEAAWQIGQTLPDWTAQARLFAAALA